MPIYEYRCAACGHELEALQKLTDAPLTECPSCHKAELRKLVSAAGFQLKGSGWYVTDFRNSGGAKPAAKDKAAANGNDQATSSAEATTKSDAPAEKSATPAATEAKPAASPASSAKSES